MRITTERGAPGFREDALDLDISIWLNGQQVFDCIMADSDVGELACTSPSLFGLVPYNKDVRKGSATLFFYKGKVEIIEGGTRRKL